MKVTRYSTFFSTLKQKLEHTKAITSVCYLAHSNGVKSIIAFNFINAHFK